MDSIYVAVVLRCCPYCQQGELFETAWTLRERCTVCGSRYDRWEGSWTGPTVIGYMFGGTTAVAAAFFLYLAGWLVQGAELAIALVTGGLTMLLFPSFKAGWIGWCHSIGYVYPDPEDDSPPSEEQV